MLSMLTPHMAPKAPATEQENAIKRADHLKATTSRLKDIGEAGVSSGKMLLHCRQVTD